MKVIVNKGRTVICDGNSLKYGEIIEMEEGEAAHLFSLGFVSYFKEKPEQSAEKSITETPKKTVKGKS